MDYVRLGTTGLKVSRLCLGAMTYGDPNWRPWVLPEDASRPFIKRALDLGINFFDTADMYSIGRSEEVLGRALRDFAGRDNVIIATKVFNPMSDDPNDRGLSRKHIMASIDRSLTRLKTDYVDLYQTHRWDPETPIEETLQALHDVVKSGKARYIGASSMASWQFAKSLYLSDRHGWTRFASMQNHYNLVYREEEREMLPLCREEGVGVIPWSPLARGFLGGTRKRGDRTATARERTDHFAHDMYYTDADYDVADRAKEVANAKGMSPAQVALAWILRQPAVTAPIIGVSKLEQLEQAVGALDLKLSDDDVRRLEEPYVPHRVLM
ncbi:MAG TPA: aldo/keto reductase [Vicinamibacterales bacterium]|jgi:aryl-alcohol dehydrogenase (NADP+)